MVGFVLAGSNLGLGVGLSPCFVACGRAATDSLCCTVLRNYFEILLQYNRKEI